MGTSLKSSVLIENTKNKSPKRNLDNKDIIKHFGKGKLNIWKKDIETGKGNFDY